MSSTAAIAGEPNKGLCALVTGAADGIGHATATRLLAEGARVLAVDRNPAGLTDFADSLVADVTESADELIGQAVTQLGSLDFLVNNAGVATGAEVAALSDELWAKVMGVNLDAVFRLSRAAIPHLKSSRRGRIVNIGSVRSQFADAGAAAYTASKHAVAGLTKTLAVELGPFGVTANYIQPGAIVTGITRQVFEDRVEFKNYWTEKAALKRLGTPADVAGAISFLLSEDASFISGHGLAVDGGAMASL